MAITKKTKKHKPELIKCSHCSRDVNPKVAYCPFCGGRILTAPITNEPVCPRCSIDLEIHTKDDMDIDICPACGGLWLDRGEFRVLTAQSTVYRDVKLIKEYSRPPIKDNFKYLECVRCGKLMVRENFKRISGVIIDRCGRHGVWLDPGELEKIRHFIVDGGLDRAQNRDIQRNRQDLRDLAITVKETAFSHRLIHFFNFKRWFFSG